MSTHFLFCCSIIYIRRGILCIQKWEISTAVYLIHYAIWQQFNLEICPFLPYSHTSAFSYGPCSSRRCSCTHRPALIHWCIQKEPHSWPQAVQPQIPATFFPSLSLSHFLLQQFKHLYANLTFPPRWTSLSISPSWKGSSWQWANPVSSTGRRAVPWFTQLG